MKRILLFVFLLAATASFGQLSIQSVDQGGVATVVLPSGIAINLKAIINPSPTSRGRLTGDAVIIDIPILPDAIEWDPSQQKNVAIGSHYNEAAGFTAYTARAYYVEGTQGSDGAMRYNLLQAQGQWENTPNPASWTRWYAEQSQPIRGFSKIGRIIKSTPTANSQQFIIGL